MNAVVWVVGVVLAYATIAGIVFRAIGGGRPCDGPHSDRGLACVGPWSIIWDSWACPLCHAYHRAMRAAWLWPFFGLLTIPRKLFWLGHDVTARPSPAKEPSGSTSVMEER